MTDSPDSEDTTFVSEFGSEVSESFKDDVVELKNDAEISARDGDGRADIGLGSARLSTAL